MADRGEISNDIEGFIISNWADTPIQFGNIDGKNPSDPSKLLSDGLDPYLFAVVQFADSDAFEVGGVLRRTQGKLYFEIRVKDGTGTRLAQTLVSKLQTMLEYKSVGDAKIRGSVSNDGFPSGGWYILPLSFKFRYDRQE